MAAHPLLVEQGQLLQDIVVAAHFAPVPPWETSSTASPSKTLQACTFVSFRLASHDSLMMLMMLYKPSRDKSQKAVQRKSSALILAIRGPDKQKGLAS